MWIIHHETRTSMHTTWSDKIYLIHKNTKREPWIFLGRKTKVSKKPLILYLKILRLKIENLKSQINALVDLRTRKDHLWWSGVAALHIHPNLLSDCSALEELGGSLVWIDCFERSVFPKRGMTGNTSLPNRYPGDRLPHPSHCQGR